MLQDLSEDAEAAQRMSDLVLFDLPKRLEGLAVTAGLYTFRESALPWFEAQASRNPENTAHQRDLSVSYKRLGDVYRDLGQTELLTNQRRRLLGQPLDEVAGRLFTHIKFGHHVFLPSVISPVLYPGADLRQRLPPGAGRHPVLGWPVDAPLLLLAGHARPDDLRRGRRQQQRQSRVRSAEVLQDRSA